ncbi:hypothetical protein K1T71_001389 [Dendrolimus kikuchii]|uniref:Uncharacterized protein n=1 Tax=Dendrolimus kikuchii TaxID=765133 RepID=A0ACC1DHJ4_9NEOP|nr:hypothetical protein K1T71_001389 [Dendrolimus kikuchii]
MAEWAGRLLSPIASVAVRRQAVRPIMPERLQRRYCSLTFRLTQVLSGHGCFGRYLCQIERESTPKCHHCVGGNKDTALHTLQMCPAWDEQRRDLVAAIEADSSFPAVVKTMVGSADAWDAANSFCKTVMSAKEA